MDKGLRQLFVAPGKADADGNTAADKAIGISHLPDKGHYFFFVGQRVVNSDSVYVYQC